MSDFTELLAELGNMQKAMPCADDKGPAKVNAAAKEGGADDAGADVPNGGADGAAEDEDLGKSFQVTLGDGTVVDAVDGSAMLKALGDQVGALRSAHETNTGDLLKGFGLVVDMLKSQQATIAGQAELIKSLQGDVAKFGSAPVGRKTVVSVLEKAAAGAQPAGKNPTRGELLAKAEALHGAGKISAVDIGMIEGSLNRGQIAAAQALLAQAER